ncbi:hypothetical protein M4V62_19030 [Streptomyces durmitorensis]|uniref:TPM domain-containing protein n=1 Tax=Streptomyces durmitorensis TaxID=319947 RepID=A0ABY4PVE4_9ACTN|nr:hypothetical protein [Streptomyces durmitorensis]UQT57027.1 hypothetical protein M4V62_19030 [Streptomyces durmitorensis]
MLATLCSLLLLGFGAAAAHPASASATEPAPTQPAALADLLRADPVYVTDQLPRDIPRSTAPQFKKLAQRTKVPTYVLVLPDQGVGADRLLAAVHDRLGRDGLYVLVDDMGVAEATAFGVRAPADDASTVALYELPYDAGPLLSFERFTDVIAQGSEKAAERAEAARQEDAAAHGEEEKLHIDPVDRDNQSFVTGIALSGVPLLVIGLSPYVRRWWRRRVTGVGAAPKAAGPPRRLTARRVEAGAAVLVAGAIALGASLVFGQETADAAPPPTATDLSSRVDRVADGLRKGGPGPVYSDPESPHVLDPAQRRELGERIAKFDRGPVFVALVPQLTEDESGGEPELFVEAVRQKMGAKGDHGVYVVADPLGGSIDVVTYDVRIDANLVAFELPDSIRYGDDDDRSTDHRLGERLDDLMTYLDKAPRTDRPETSSLGMDDEPDPVEENALSPLFSGDFWPGLMVGAVAAALVFGIVAALLGILRLAVPGLRRPRTTSSPSATTSSATTSFEAPPDPSHDYLRRTARDELDALAREFDAADEQSALASAVRTRVWDCLDTATLLADRDPDGHVDDDATPADLAAAVVLARAGRGALVGADKTCCALNPLHGPATGWRDARYAAEDQRLRTIPVCAQCRVLVAVQPRLAHTLRLTLPGARRGERVPYEEAPGPLPAARDGISQLIRQVREYAGVQ